MTSLNKGGRGLLPGFALGKAQELLLILNEYWNEHEELKDVPIYYTGLLATKSLSVFQTYRNMMREDTKEKVNQLADYRLNKEKIHSTLKIIKIIWKRNH